MLTLKPGYALIYLAGEVSYLQLFLLMFDKLLLLLFYRRVLLHLLNSVWGMLLGEVNVAGIGIGCTLCTRNNQVRLRRGHVWNISEGVATKVYCWLWIRCLLKLLDLNVWIVSLQSNILLALLVDCLIMIEARMWIGTSHLGGHSCQRYRLDSCFLDPIRSCLVVNEI